MKFNEMTPEQRRAIASKGGRSGKKHQFSKEERSKGGKAAQLRDDIKAQRFTPEQATRINIENRWKRLKDAYKEEDAQAASDQDETNV